MGTFMVRLMASTARIIGTHVAQELRFQHIWASWHFELERVLELIAVIQNKKAAQYVLTSHQAIRLISHLLADFLSGFLTPKGIMT